MRQIAGGGRIIDAPAHRRTLVVILLVDTPPRSPATRPTESDAHRGAAMTELVRTMAPPADAPAVSTDHLDRLVSRVAAGERPAFRCLYAFMAVRVWKTAARALPHPGHALAVTRSTFLEVWQTAGAAARYDARDWLDSITAFRVDERQRVLDEHDRHGIEADGAGRRVRATGLVDYDDHVHRELVNALGAGRATIRVGPATFVRIEDLDRAIDAIAATGHRHRYRAAGGAPRAAAEESRGPLVRQSARGSAAAE